jgi:rubredoxin
MSDVSQRAANGTRLKSTSCPTCGYEMDAATPTPSSGNVRPRSGDISLCAKCGEVLQFDANIIPRVPTLSEMVTWPEDVNAEVLHVQRVIRSQRIIK